VNSHLRAPKKGRKYDQVIAGAREVFLREGFEGASVDAIARASGVSKATLYSYFRDKKLLFLEVAKTECLRQSETAFVLARSSKSVRATLRDVAERMTGFFLSDLGQRVFRICIAEADRFPEIGRTFYQSGPELARGRLAAYLQEAVARGDLQIDDCKLAADQFAELCKADLFPRLMFNVTDSIPREDVERVIDGAVEMFMARYGVPGRGG
jgi:AcrR family transcriptional regulator